MINSIAAAIRIEARRKCTVFATAVAIKRSEACIAEA
jgi:hypothetical protein